MIWKTKRKEVGEGRDSSNLVVLDAVVDGEEDAPPLKGVRGTDQRQQCWVLITYKHNASIDNIHNTDVVITIFNSYGTTVPT